MSDVLVVITNHNFNDNAIRQKRNFSKYFPTIIVDSGSCEQPDEFDVKMCNVYYAGLWNEAVKQALDRGATWLLFVASDVEIEDYAKLCSRMTMAMADTSIGMYSPGIMEGSRSAFPENFCRSSNVLRDVRRIEGFFFLCRVSIVKKQYPVDVKVNDYGFNIDIITSELSRKMGYRNAIDDQVQIFHPESKIVDTAFYCKACMKGYVYRGLYKIFGLTNPNRGRFFRFFYRIIFYFLWVFVFIRHLISIKR